MSNLSTSTVSQPAPVTSPPSYEGTVQVADFEAVFLRFQGPITNFIYHLIGNREQACDLAQDVFVKAYKALLHGTVVQSGALSAWLYRIAANTTTDMLRRRRLIAWLPLSLFNEDRSIGEGIVSSSTGITTAGLHESAAEGTGSGWMTSSHQTHGQGGYQGGRFEDRVADREILQRVFGQMPRKYAICLWLFQYEGLSCAELAETLSISVSAAKMRLKRSRERFIALYQREMDMSEQEAGAA